MAILLTFPKGQSCWPRHRFTGTSHSDTENPCLRFSSIRKRQQRILSAVLIGHAAEISSTTGISVPKLRSEAARLAPESAPLGQQCLREWLSALDECSQPGKGF
jgi:hypothetical protein